MIKDLVPSGDEMITIKSMAQAANDSKFFQTLNGGAGIMSIMLYARELGLPMMQCLFGGMHNIQGKVQISPQLMNSMIRQKGHRLEVDATNERCIIKGVRCDTGESQVASFSVEDARKAGIYKSGGAWEKYPEDMCFARALSRIARRLFPDVIGVSYVEGEIESKEKETPCLTITQEPSIEERFEEITKEIPKEEVNRYFQHMEAISKKPRSFWMEKWVSNPQGAMEHFNKTLVDLAPHDIIQEANECNLFHEPE